MRIKWKIRRGVRPQSRWRYICEVRRSEKRRDGRNPLQQRKLTLAHLGTLRAAEDGAPRPEEVARFCREARPKLRPLGLSRVERARLLRAIAERFPRRETRAALTRALRIGRRTRRRAGAK